MKVTEERFWKKRRFVFQNGAVCGHYVHKKKRGYLLPRKDIQCVIWESTALQQCVDCGRRGRGSVGGHYTHKYPYEWTKEDHCSACFFRRGRLQVAEIRIERAEDELQRREDEELESLERLVSAFRGLLHVRSDKRAEYAAYRFSEKTLSTFRYRI